MTPQTETYLAIEMDREGSVEITVVDESNESREETYTNIDVLYQAMRDYDNEGLDVYF